MSMAAGHEGNGSSASLASDAVPGQPEALLWAYADQEAHARALRSITAAEHPAAIAAWLFGLDLFATAFAPDWEHGTSPTTTPAGDLYVSLRREMLARAARGAKPALDLILAGYYREAWALERTMLDEWAQSIYLRLWPTADPPPSCEPAWREVARVIVAQGDERDRSLFDEATPRWEFLTVSLRPLSGQTASLSDANPESVTYQSAYQAPLCSLAFSCGFFIQCAILSELAALDGHPEEWLTWYATFREAAARLHAPGRSEMERFMQERAERCMRIRTPQ